MTTINLYDGSTIRARRVGPVEYEVELTDAKGHVTATVRMPRARMIELADDIDALL